MPRQEASLEGRPQHLRALAEAMRAIRNDSGLTLKQLSERAHYAESTLSRATNALDLPPWKIVKAFMTHCGVIDIAPWQAAWEETRERHEAFQAEGSGAPPRASLAAPSTPQPALERLAEERAPTLALLLSRAQTPQDLTEAIRVLGARAGATSLRQMEMRGRVAKSTIRDWLAGARRPNAERLDGLVQALGASSAEQRMFAQCIERVWSQRPPHLEVSPAGRLSPIGTKRGGHCFLLTVTVYERNLESGLVVLAGKPRGVLGITAGPSHSVVGRIALLPKVRRNTEFTIGIWLDSPADATGQLVELDVQTETPDQQWHERLKITLPQNLGSVAARISAPNQQPPASPNRGPEHNRQGMLRPPQQPPATLFRRPERNRPGVPKPDDVAGQGVEFIRGSDRTASAASQAAALSRSKPSPSRTDAPRPPRPRPVVHLAMRDRSSDRDPTVNRAVKEDYPTVSERVQPAPSKSTESEYQPKHRKNTKPLGLWRWVMRKPE